jgi:hypothetical protein
MLTLALTVCIELPRRRQEERFQLNERGAVKWPDGSLAPCIVSDMSVGGARLMAIRAAAGTTPQSGCLLVDGGALEIPFKLIRTIEGNRLAIKFEDDTKLRRALIIKLFSGAHRNKVEKINIPLVLFSVSKKLLT